MSEEDKPKWDEDGDIRASRWRRWEEQTMWENTKRKVSKFKMDFEAKVLASALAFDAPSIENTQYPGNSGTLHISNWRMPFNPEITQDDKNYAIALIHGALKNGDLGIQLDTTAGVYVDRLNKLKNRAEDSRSF